MRKKLRFFYILPEDNNRDNRWTKLYLKFWAEREEIKWKGEKTESKRLMMVIKTVRKIIIKLEKDTYFADSTETTIKLIKGERQERRCC